jgi:ParB family transcriptional regulator, chromosome partitioning protein
MSIKRNGLGRNLSALLGTPSTSAPSTEPIKLPLHALQPGKYQPRRVIEEGPLEELAASIQQQGLLQPILVRELDDQKYEILAGERRWRACQRAGLVNIPVIIKPADDQTAMAIALIENLQREDLTVLDQAQAMHRLHTEFDLTHQQIAALVHKSRTAVSNFLRLLTLSPQVKNLLDTNQLDMGHARTLLGLQESEQNQVAEIIVKRGLSVRETENLVNRLKKGNSTEKISKEPNPLYTEKLSTISECLQTRVQLKPGKLGKGSLVIHYDNAVHLQKVLERLGVLEGLERNM